MKNIEYSIEKIKTKHKKPLPITGGNGRSFKNAIIINGDTNGNYFELEQLVIDLLGISTGKKLKIKQQSIKTIEDKCYDIFIIQDQSCSEINKEFKLIFDVTACW